MQLFLGQKDPMQSWPVQNGQCKVETNPQIYLPYQRLYYTEFIEVSVACEMHFNDFPKDKHSCDLIFGAYDFSSSTIMYTAPIVVYDSERIDQENEVLEVQSASSKYNIKIVQIQPYETNFKIKGTTIQESKT